MITDDDGTRHALITIDDRGYVPAEGQVLVTTPRGRIHPDCVGGIGNVPPPRHLRVDAGRSGRSHVR